MANRTSSWNKRGYNENNYKEDRDRATKVVHLKLDCAKRYAHTASSSYHLKMATLQPDDRVAPNCACSQINKGAKNSDDDSRVIVIVEHDLKENILCILDSKKMNQCKLDLKVQSGEQIAFRTIGKIPVQLSGVSTEAR